MLTLIIFFVLLIVLNELNIVLFSCLFRMLTSYNMSEVWYRKVISLYKNYVLKKCMHTSCTVKYAWPPFDRKPKVRFKKKTEFIFHDRFIIIILNKKINAILNFI